MSTGSTSLDVVLETAVAAARREILILAVAIHTNDVEGAMVSGARLRSALAYLDELGTRHANGAADATLAAIRCVAARWFPRIAALGLTTRRIERLLHCLRSSVADRSRSIDASAMRLDELELDELALPALRLCRSEVTGVTARRANLDDLDAIGATIARCRFDECSMVAAQLDEATFDDCQLPRARLDGTSWRAARVSRCQLAGSVWLDAVFDHAMFVDCDLRGVDFSARAVAPVVAATFVRCDLRDTSWRGRRMDRVSLLDCKLYGAHGGPELENVAIVQPDVSPAADGSRIATESDVALGWCSRVGHG